MREHSDAVLLNHDPEITKYQTGGSAAMLKATAPAG